MIYSALKSFCFWLAVPLVMPQALYVRLTAPRFAPPQDGSMGQINPATVIQSKPIELLAIGDSIIAGVGTDQFQKALVGQVALALSHSLQQPVRYHGFGKVGIDSEYLVNRQLPKVMDYFKPEAQVKPKSVKSESVKPESVNYIIVSTGVNDATSLLTQRRYTANLVQIINQLQQQFTQATIGVVGFPSLADFPLIPNPLGWLFGIRSHWLNACIADACEQSERAIYIPVSIPLSIDDFAEDGYHPNEQSYQLFGEAVAKALLTFKPTNELIK